MLEHAIYGTRERLLVAHAGSLGCFSFWRAAPFQGTPVHWLHSTLRGDTFALSRDTDPKRDLLRVYHGSAQMTLRITYRMHGQTDDRLWVVTCGNPDWRFEWECQSHWRVHGRRPEVSFHVRIGHRRPSGQSS